MNDVEMCPVCKERAAEVAVVLGWNNNKNTIGYHCLPCAVADGWEDGQYYDHEEAMALADKIRKRNRDARLALCLD